MVLERKRMFLLVLGILVGLLFMTHGISLHENLNSSEDICRLFPDGAILRKPGSCKETIKCDNGNSLKHSVTCSGSKIIKLDRMTCAADSAKSPDKYCRPICNKNSPRYIQDVKNCNEWTECDKQRYVKSGICPLGQIFKQDEQLCDYENEECSKTFNVCDVAKTNQRFGDENNCHKYFYCNAKRELQVVKCPTSMYYDVRSGVCMKKTQVNCYRHPLPEEGCGTKKRAVLNQFIDDQATCRGYFYCRNLGRSKDGNYIPDENAMWGQCPLGKFFNEENGSCQSLNYVKCNEDRCDGRNSGNILSETPGCQHYLVCKNGMTVDEFKCPDNKYFDPTDNTCVDRTILYPICS